MPNILAHSHITTSVLGEKEPDVVLGSTLPDFAGMYLARHGGFVAIRGLNEEFDRGIRFHATTDVASDQQPEYPRITAPLSVDLEEAGIPERVARLTASFAADVLLDRALLDSDLALWDFRLLRERVLEHGTALKTGVCAEPFTRYVEGYFRDDGPRRYRDSRHIAYMIHYRLTARSDRPDAVVSDEQVPVVADIIDSHADRVGGLGLDALQRVIEDLRSRAGNA